MLSNWNKDKKVFIDNNDGLNWFFKQMLTGDDTDHILGCAKRITRKYKSGAKIGLPYKQRVGVGPKEADAILEGLSLDDQWCAVGLHYAIHTDDPEARMQEDGSLLWMMRKEGDHFDLYRMINGEES